MKKYGDILQRGTKDITCDRCKKSTAILIGNPDIYNFSYATLEARWPYGSPKDAEHHQLHLCEPCYDWLSKLLADNSVTINIADGDAWHGESILDIGEPYENERATVVSKRRKK